MVYPPPPPPHSLKPDYSPIPQHSGTFNNSPSMSGERRGSIQLPPMGSWAPPPLPSPHPDQSSARFLPQDEMRFATDKGRAHKRRPSDAEEVEAGLALAGMANRAKKEPASAGQSQKKAKKDDGKKEKDNRKSCSECRRLKAKCDRVFPCSNCELPSCAKG